MNPDTGDIKPFKTRADAAKAGYSIPLDSKPDPKCKKCLGLGHLGRDVDTGQYEPCACCKKKKD